jgi:hypothetical protein
MGSLILGVLFVFAGFAAWMIFNKIADLKAFRSVVGGVLVIVGSIIGVMGGVSYNDAGYCQHVRTIFGNESSTCNTGWYFQGWGTSTEWPHYITVANTIDVTAEGSAIAGPYKVRLADNWTGDVTQTTRFGIPQDEPQFIKMARDFRSPERLITTTLKPAVTASMDSVANMFTMEEYYAGGKRDTFKSEFAMTVEQGRAQVRQVRLNQAGGIVPSRAAASSSDVTANTAEVGDTDVRSVLIEKLTDAAGNDMRIPHAFMEYGIAVSSAILENVDPDDEYERQIGERKSAASRRVVAREQRLEQEEQRLLAIQAGDTNIAKRQAAAQVEQIQATTDAETQKKLALIAAERIREEARIAQETAGINLQRARIDAESVTVAADAEAYAKQAILEADGALAQKLEAWVSAQRVWADAASKINVPSTVIAGGGEGGTGSALDTVGTFMQMMMVKTAQDLAVDPTIRP